MQLSQALNPRRIARSLVTVLVITLLQSVVPVVLSPIVSAPKAEAVTATVTPTSNASGSTFVVPTGVFSIAFEVMGGAGGKGGDDVNIGKSGTVAGRVFATFAVTPGDVIGLYPGKAGTDGVGGGSGTAGGLAGTDTLPGGAYSINGTYFTGMDFGGGAGGTPGTYGASGSGGGAGAASVVTINSEIVIIAGGAGGGGGTGSGSNTASDWNGSLSPNGSNFNGTTGTNTPLGTCGGVNGNDGGAGGGGGGGYYGGTGGTAVKISNECAGTSGSPGGNYLAARASITYNDRSAFTSEGSTKYTYDAQALAACAKTTTTVDIYTVEQVSYVGNCTWSVPSTVNVIDMFLVGGGGGGGGDAGSGGGGGAGLLRTAIAVTPSSNITLKVGYGGAGGSWGYSWNPIPGDATTLTLASGTTFTANGGSGGTPGPGSGSAAGGTASNGGFAGGAGGTSPACNNVGLAGKTGVTNYFYGTVNTYGGGGGGGVCTNSAATTPAAGANGGGAGGYAVSSSLNAPGGNATPGSGSGGGGGVATGSGQKINAGKGGSGIILIRYATNSADAFPVALTSSLSARWIPDGLQMADSSRKGWIDASGTNASVATGNISGTPTIGNRSTTDGASATRSSKTLMSVSGTTTDNITLVDLPSNYTMFNIARYRTTGSKGRLITTNTGNWLTGHYNGNAGLTHHNYWLTPDATNVPSNVGWVLSTDQLKLYRADGLDVSYVDNGYQNAQSTSTGFGVNNSNYAQKSDFDVADILVFNRQLTNGEIRLMESYLARIYGLTLVSTSTNAETDTAATLDTSQQLIGPSGYGGAINDTFTIETWVKPATYCATGLCMFVVRENAILLGMHVGTLRYAIYGKTVGGWTWTDTQVKIPVNEWHHISMVKQYTGDLNGSLLFYLDGQLVYTVTGTPYTGTGSNFNSASSAYAINDNDDQYIYVGSRYVADQRLVGQIDEVKIWKAARTLSQIQSDMHSNDTSSATLQYYWDFNRTVGSSTVRIPNLAANGVSRGDLSISGSPTFTDVKVTTTTGPYTTITFPRTYITQTGGWKVPSTVTTATTIVVGGGGGAGKTVSNQSSPAGAGGGGGVTYSPTQQYVPDNVVQIKVGVGGVGATAGADDASLRNGSSSFVGIQSGLTALGGGGGGSNNYPGAGGSTVATGGGGGGSPTSGSCAVLGPVGGTVPSGYNGARGGWGWGGLGGSARGAATTSSCYGIAADGFIDSVTPTAIEYGRTGSNQYHSTWSTNANYTTANNGWGGSVSYGGSAVASGAGISGSAGVVIIRYITALKPTYTSPTTAYLNVGMTETFTTNVAQDSATVMLTRTFRWESTTADSGGTFTPIKVGTGATNAAFSWVPSDTSTSGSQYLYRVVVTDSDTAGLFIVDTTTPVFAVINRTLAMTGPTSIKKAINIARNETFTISNGTPGYRYSLSPVIPGVTIDTATVGSTILKISDTASTGTYFETLTVTDSVSASVVIPFTLTISAPPSLVNTSETYDTDLEFSIDMANSASYSRTTGLISDISGTKKPVTIVGGSTFNDDYSGNLKLSTSQYISATGFRTLPAFSIEAYINLQSISTGQVCIFGSEQNPTNVPYFMCIDSGRTVFTGFYNGVWTYKRTTQTLTLGAWTHLVGVFDSTTSGTKMELYINGAATTLSDSAQNAGLIPPAASSDKIFINKWFYTTTAPTSAMDIGFVRLYRAPLSDVRVLQNYNASKDRFAVANINQIKPSQKYGTIALDSFTVTSGGDTETVSFAVGSRAGITWDTASTPGQIKLTVQDTLTPGTYYDTITVTDNFAQSTNLPIKFTVTKADTLTIYIDTPTALNYTGNSAIFTPSVKTIGAVGLESGTAISTTMRFKPAGTTCATGGYCRIGDIGPGGGIVFIDTSTASSDGRIYEVAPQNWSGSDDLSTVNTFCSSNSSTIGSTQIGIGWGETNTNLAKTNCLGGAVGRVNTFNSSNSTGYLDWFIPSRNEGIELAKIAATAGLLNIGSNWSTGIWGYWGSTEVSSSVMSSIGHAGAVFNGTANVSKSESTKNMVRPVRAFKSCWAIDTCTALLNTETPTAAGVYVISPTDGPSAATLAERYSSVRFIESRLTINRIAQRAQVIPFINVNFPDTFTVNVTEGNGNGALTYSVVNGTATGCALDYKKLYTTTQGTCTVTVVKAGDRNYLPDTVTAGMLMLSFVLNQPSPAVGSGPTIALSGQTSITLDPNVAPTISSLSTYTAQAGVTTLIITGVGFDSSNLAGITVKFWRNVLGTGFTVNAQNSQITVTVPVGATTGKITVTTPNGQAVSEFVLTITP